MQADAIEASFDNGVLEVLVPKAEQAKPKKITVRAGGGQEVPGTSTPADGA
ncbi:MAG TPA: Hsp20 family protein [Actinomycetota bacterium]|nr:Hsp20 family protein [Actinomycetota bacterium]